MGNFNLQDYETVESRLKRFYADHSEQKTSIVTEMVSYTENYKEVVF